MQISAISELGQIQENELSLATIFRQSSQVSSYLYISEVIGEKNVERQFLIEASVPDDSNDYDSCKIPYSLFVSGAIFRDVKGFLNLSNGLISSDGKTDYNLDQIFNAQQTVNKLSVFDAIYATYADIASKINAMEAKFERLSSDYAKISELTADKFEVPNENAASIAGNLIVNNIVGTRKSLERAVTVFADRDLLKLNLFSIGVSVDWNASVKEFSSINVPVGAIIPFVGDFPVAGTGGDQLEKSKGFLLCDGDTFIAKDYPDLFAAIGYTFGNKNGNPMVPDLTRGRYLVGLENYVDQYGTIRNGAYLDEALPNISGMIVAQSNVVDAKAGIDGLLYTGALYKGTASIPSMLKDTSSLSDSLVYSSILFDAKHGQINYENKFTGMSNPIYGKDDQYNSVRPKSMTVSYYIKAKQAKSDFTDEKDDNLSCLMQKYIPDKSLSANLVGATYDPGKNALSVLLSDMYANCLVNYDDIEVWAKNGSDNYQKITRRFAYVPPEALIDIVYPVGSIYLSLNQNLPSNFDSLKWVRIATGMCLWGAGSVQLNDGSGNVRVLNAGTYLSSGLPNITGVVDFKGNGAWGSPDVYDSSTTGAFKAFTQSEWQHNVGSLGTGHLSPGFSFSAKKSNPIYGNSDIVQPPALVVSMWLRIK